MTSIKYELYWLFRRVVVSVAEIRIVGNQATQQRIAIVVQWAAIASALAFFCATANAELGNTHILVETGDPSPDGNGIFEGLVNPKLNDSGQVAFYAFLTDTFLDGPDLSNPFLQGADRVGIFRADNAETVAIVRSYDRPVDGPGRFSVFMGRFHFDINNSGQVVYSGAIAFDAPAGTTGIYLGDGQSTTSIARVGASFNATDQWARFETLVSYDVPNSLNDAGMVSFKGGARNTSGGYGGVFISDGATTATVSRFGDAIEPVITARTTLNNQGSVAFWAKEKDADQVFEIFQGNGAELSPVVRVGDPTPEGRGVFNALGPVSLATPAFNDFGQVAFYSSEPNPSDPTERLAGLYVVDQRTSYRIARKGDAIPGGNGTFRNVPGDFRESLEAFNNQGQVAFSASVETGVPGAEVEYGLFRGSADQLVEVFRTGETTPDGNHFFATSRFSDGTFNDQLAINDRGQLAFTAIWSDSPGGGNAGGALFFYDDSIGLIEVVRAGAEFAGSTITAFNFNPDGLNNQGQIAYQFVLADNRHGIAVWSPVPEPSAMVLFLLGGLVFPTRHSRPNL